MFGTKEWRQLDTEFDDKLNELTNDDNDTSKLSPIVGKLLNICSKKIKYIKSFLIDCDDKFAVFYEKIKNTDLIKNTALNAPTIRTLFFPITNISRCVIYTDFCLKQLRAYKNTRRTL